MADQRRDIGHFIREQRKLAQLSVRKLADRAGVSNPYLSQIERGLRKPSAEILQQLAKALELSAETMYVQAGMLDADAAPRPVDLPSAIRAAAELTEEQRQALLGVYWSFVKSGEGDSPDRPAESTSGAASGQGGAAVGGDDRSSTDQQKGFGAPAAG
jgi:transcriptional regulator with XRE-family HTH domain